MAILKIRDANGKVQEIYAIRGEKGDPGADGKDYVLTEADKAEIAGMIPSSGGSAEAVLYSAQNLTEEQKTQARTNIGALNSDGVLKVLTNFDYITLRELGEAEERLDGRIDAVNNACLATADELETAYCRIDTLNTQVTEINDILTDLNTDVPDVINRVATLEEMIGIEEEFSVSGELVQFDLDIEPGTALEVVSKIQRDTNWEPSNELVLHQVSSSNFVDFTSFLGGAGTVFENSGLTATINADNTVTISGTNEASGWINIINKYHWDGEQAKKVYPAGTYTLPAGFTMNVRAAHYPAHDVISGVSSNLAGTVTITEPFRIIHLFYAVKGGASVNVTLPLGLFYGSSIPEAEYQYQSNIYTITFDRQVYDGEFNWSTGELKDAEGNTVAYYSTQEIATLPGVNYFWTGFGENIISNASGELNEIVLGLNESAPAETVPSVCDFTLTPSTPEAAYGLYFSAFLPGGQFMGNEVPVLTTKGALSVKDVDGNVKYSKYIDPIFNNRGVADLLTNKGLEKRWSGKFYLNKEPVSITHVPPPYTGMLDNYVFTWEFDESEFINSGIPAKVQDIAMVSPCFINNDSSKSKITGYSEIWGGTPYPAFFSYDAETQKYVLKAKGLSDSSILYQLTGYSKVYFHYQLETPYQLPFGFALGIEAGDVIAFEPDLKDNQPYLDSLSTYKGDITPTITALVPCGVSEAMVGMVNVAHLLNMGSIASGDTTAQGYGWIGEGDGITDYTAQIQAKIDELHTATNGGTLHFGPGVYPISKNLLVYDNILIIGDGQTVIEQRADNTHAIVLNGSHITIRDLTIKLAGECTELTACIYANSNNIENGMRLEQYPENRNVWHCAVDRVTLSGTYGFSWNDNGAYVSERMLAYRGVGILNLSLYFNFFEVDNATCKNLYAGVYNGAGASIYNIFVIDSRNAVIGGGGNNIWNIAGHSFYILQNGGYVTGSDYIFYGEYCDNCDITIAFYDTQYMIGSIYFDGWSQHNRYSLLRGSTELSTLGTNIAGKHDFKSVEDYGRNNSQIEPFTEKFLGIGPIISGVSGLPVWNTQFNPSLHNALSGAGVWGNISSNRKWYSHDDGFTLSDICRYPKEVKTDTNDWNTSYILCESAPREDFPIEIIIDIHERPVTCARGCWIQFANKYIASDYQVYCDTSNDGNFNTVFGEVTGNTEAISYKINYQMPIITVYRMKIIITKALQIPEFSYCDAGYNEHVIDYNPDGLIGIINIGLPTAEAYGRAFLGECGGSLYGNVDMHQNTLKNLLAPVDAADAVNKAYVEECIANLPVYEGTYREIYTGEVQEE